jgi:hypothetical protein
MPVPAYEPPGTHQPFAPAQPFPAAPAQPFAAQVPTSVPQPRAEQRPAPALPADPIRRDRTGLRHAPSEQGPVWAREEPAAQPGDRAREQAAPRVGVPGRAAQVYPDGSPGRGLDEDLAMTTGRWSLGETRPVTVPPDLGNTGDPDGIIRRVGRHRTPALENLDFVAGLGLRDSGEHDEVGPSS